MAGHRPFKELTSKMSPASQANAEAKAKLLGLEMELAAPTMPFTGHTVRQGTVNAAKLSVRDLSTKTSKRFPKVLAELAK